MPTDTNPNGEDTSQEDNHGGKGLEMPMKGEKDLEMPTEDEKGLEMPMDEHSSRKDPLFEKQITVEKAWRCPWTQIPMEKTLPKRITLLGKAWRCPRKVRKAWRCPWMSVPPGKTHYLRRKSRWKRPGDVHGLKSQWRRHFPRG